MPAALVLPVAFALGLVVMPLAIRLAWLAGFLDHPEARKMHTSATALLGGFAVFVVALSTSIAAGAGHAPGWPERGWWMFAGAVVSFGIGLWDDRFGMHPRVKLFGQGVPVTLLLASGALPDYHLGTFLNIVISTVVILALMNAINFLDNMNGMVGGLSAIALGAFAWGSASRGDTGVATAQLALAGACAGFLPYNFPKARIFLGDAGSLLLGYSLAASAALAFQRGPQGWGQLGPIIALGYPAFDMIFVVAMRKRDGIKVSVGGQDHSNHRIAKVLKWKTRTVLLLWLLGAVLSVSGLAVQSLNRPIPTILLSVLWLMFFQWGWKRLSSVPIDRHPLPPTK